MAGKTCRSEVVVEDLNVHVEDSNCGFIDEGRERGRGRGRGRGEGEGRGREIEVEVAEERKSVKGNIAASLSHLSVLKYLARTVTHCDLLYLFF